MTKSFARELHEAPQGMVSELTAVVAVPIRNECQRVAACLQSLAGQVGVTPRSLGILLFLNNCTDGTADVVASVIPDLPWPIRVLDVTSDRATAGWARRCAMEAGARWLEESGARDGVILTTDADSRVGAEWVERNLACIAAGADAVAGRISLDCAEAGLLPDSLHARGRLEAQYEALLTEIGARLDPEPGDHWPCHWTNSGATLAVRRKVYDAVGGMPALRNGEDRAFTAAVQAAGYAVRHAPEIMVVTSGRLDGRAPGGAADTMRLRCEVPDSPCDERLERLRRAVWRVLWRRYLRQAFAGKRLASSRGWSTALGIAASEARTIAELPTFGQAHAAIEAASPRLAYLAVEPSRLPLQIKLANALVKFLRRPKAEGRRAGSAPFDPGVEAGRTQPTLP